MWHISQHQIFTFYTSKLTIDKSFNRLCDAFDEFVGLDVMAEQMVQKMQFIIEVHKSLRMWSMFGKKKGRHMLLVRDYKTFDDFEVDIKVKMHRLGKKKTLMCN
jgi:hypothetical protein